MAIPVSVGVGPISTKHLNLCSKNRAWVSIQRTGDANWYDNSLMRVAHEGFCHCSGSRGRPNAHPKSFYVWEWSLVGVQGCHRSAHRQVTTLHRTRPLQWCIELEFKEGQKKDEGHIPPGTPPQITLAIATLASRNPLRHRKSAKQRKSVIEQGGEQDLLVQ